MFRLPHRHIQRCTLVKISVLLTVYILFRATVGGHHVNVGGSILPYGSISPLLGKNEDAGRFWFPARDDGHDFYPQPLSINQYPRDRRTPRAPLFIGFTRNNDMLVQTVLSFIATGWPRTDIIVVDNSGTMDANPQVSLSRANPFFLDYELLRRRYGVNVLQTPTLLSFSQLQNFFLHTALGYGWPYYLTAHMDVVVLSDESVTPYVSLFASVATILAEVGVQSGDIQSVRLAADWAVKFFAYDWLTLVNVQSWRTIGAWDPFIPYYHADCDAYSRAVLHNYTIDTVHVGSIYDVAVALPEPESLFFPTTKNETVDSPRYRDLRQRLETLSAAKQASDRNTWQAGHDNLGHGEPWTYDPEGFHTGWWNMAKVGRQWYKKKWGTTGCELKKAHIRLENEFASIRLTVGRRWS